MMEKKTLIDQVTQLEHMIENSHHIVLFSGAGVSTESGLKDFRSKDGMYSQSSKYPTEYMLSSDMFWKHTEEFYEYYKKNFNCLDVQPNITHQYFKKLEDKNKLRAIVTQNIDGLHTKAGNKKVYEIHGTIMTNHCTQCYKNYDASYVFQSKGIPTCTCGGMIKTDVVLYGESLPEDAFEASIQAIQDADLLIVAGTSLTVEPASSLIRLFQGNYLVILNQTETSYDDQADLVIHDSLKNIFKNLHK